MLNLGLMYKYGLGVEQNQDKAMDWHLKSIDAGNTKAMVVLAQMYDAGDGCAKDHELAVSWYKKAAGMGNILAREKLASLGENW